ncbi:MAG: alpha-amylase [Firmicutes bacterium]|nr:alpha-amylase [Bacillota bacterium]
MNRMNLLEELYFDIYGHSTDTKHSFKHLVSILENARTFRKDDLKKFDRHTEWYFHQNVIGITLYIDLFAGNIKKLTQKIDYFKDLGINFIHLMPLLKPRDGENDGGYAVEDYRQIDSRLGSMDDFTHMLDVLREHQIYICIDYVINHVAKEHEWAKKALNNQKDMQEMFIMFDTEEIPNQYNRTVPEVLPDKCPGNFTYYPEIKKYVFTSFSDFQWDLNFKNPRVFNGMADHMLYLANLGVNMIRLDAIPFMWKEIGTSCRNLKPIHNLLKMLHLIKDEVCPSVALLGEAIVEPVEIVKYFGNDQDTECEIMYNANLMVNVLNSFATRDVRLLQTDTNLHQIPKKSTWMNYVRCHDDIGWGFNEHAITLYGMDPYQHKQFLIRFYGNDFPGTFSTGERYQYNHLNHDARINGTLASLLGLEKAIKNHDSYLQELAIKRINLAHALILFYRGFPLIYSGDEIATINDQTYLKDPAKMNEGRWVHRPFFDWKRSKNKDIDGTPEFEVYQSLKKLIRIRKMLPFLDGRTIQFTLNIGNMSIFCLVRKHQDLSYISLFNFSENTQLIKTDMLRQNLSSTTYIDLIEGRNLHLDEPLLELSPYEFIWAQPV